MRRKLIFFMAAWLTVMNASATSFFDTIRPPRPKVGIVLGGGGARGAAHIGALKLIDELGIPVDYVAGTSMGSIIGGLYALGYTPDEIEYLISHLDWDQYMSNDIERQDISMTDKQRRSTYLISIPFDNGQLADKIRGLGTNEESPNGKPVFTSLPDSFIGGTSLLNLFNNLCVGYQEPIDFNDLPIPFACVATDIATGEAVVMRSGKVPEAIRASMSIPGVFSPIMIDGKLLVDGGLVNNFPTDVCRDMGADIIIGIEVAEGLINDPERLKTLPQLVTQLSNIMTEGHNAENRKLCDLYIHPKVDDYTTLSFNAEAIDTIVHRGYRCASSVREELMTIKRYVDSFEPSSKTLQGPRAYNAIADTLQLKSVTMDNVNTKEFNWLLRKSQLPLESDITGKDIQRAINIFKGTGSFSSVEYLLTPARQREEEVDNLFDLHFKFHPSDPHNLSLGFNYNSEESAALIVNLGLGQNKFSGWKYNLNGRIGLNTKIRTTLTWAGLSLANFNAEYSYSHVKYNAVLERPTEAKELFRHRGRLYISEFHLRTFQTQVGFEIERQMKTQTWGPYAMLRFDNMDKAYFATSGLSAHMEIHERLNRSSALPMTDICFGAKYHVSMGAMTFIPQLYSRWLMTGTAMDAYGNIIGGEVQGRYYDYQLPFVGLNNTKVTDPFTTIARLDLRYRLMPKHYLTLIGNAMRSAETLDAFFAIDEEKPGYWGAALKYSYSSPIGPISVDIHYSDLTRQWGSYFSLGYEF